MVKIYYDNDANLALIKETRFCVIGYGSQGHAHALNLRDSGCQVVVAYPDLQSKSKTIEKARQDGFNVLKTGDAVKQSNFIMFLAPDEFQSDIYQNDILPNLKKGDTLMFAHGFNVHFGQIIAPDFVNVVLIAPKGPGHLVRRVYTEGGGVPCVVAVEQDASGNAKEIALAYAKGIGGTRAGVLETTFKEETETDLFGEQTVLCGGLTSLMINGFETLVEAGYQPEIAYFECLHELKLIVDLLYEGGFEKMRFSVSDTAEYGDYVSGKRLITDEVKKEMKNILTEIQDGTFATKWILENQANRPSFLAMRRIQSEHLSEKVGAELREKMSWKK